MIRALHSTALTLCILLASTAGAQERAAGQVSPSLTQLSEDLPESMRDATADFDRQIAIAGQSADLRTRTMLAWRNPLPAFPQGSAGLVALAEEAKQSQDPVVLMMMATGCDAPEIGCNALVFAGHWTEVDQNNGAAWLELWIIDTRLGDTSGAELALAQAVAASDWRDYTLDLTRAFVGVAPADADVLVRLVAHLQSAPRVVGIVNSLYRNSLALCRLSSKRDACMRVTDLIARQPVSLLQATVAASLAKNFGGTPALVTTRRERVEAWQWAIAQNQPVGLLTNDPRANAGEVIAYIDGLNSAGEVAAAQKVLAERHLSEAEAAARYREARRATKEMPLTGPGTPILPPVGAGLHAPIR